MMEIGYESKLKWSKITDELPPMLFQSEWVLLAVYIPMIKSNATIFASYAGGNEWYDDEGLEVVNTLGYVPYAYSELPKPPPMDKQENLPVGEAI